MTIEFSLCIDGEWICADARSATPVINPSTEEVLGSAPIATSDDLERALAAADRSFASWGATDVASRAQLLRKVAKVITNRTEEIARVIALEQGKPLQQSRGEVGGGVEVFEWYAEECRRSYGRVVPSPDPTTELKVIYEPVGPAAVLTPWNFPFAEAATHMAAGLAAGCPIILKAPSEAPGSGVQLVRAVHDAGIPAGVVNLVLGPSANISDHLISSPIIRKIGFTGSTPVGRLLAGKAAAELKMFTGELGGNAPVILFDDFDVATAVDRIVPRKLRNAGQVCTAPNRFFVHERIHDAFVDSYTKALVNARIGDAIDETTDMGPLVNERRIAAMDAFVKDAMAKGATLHHGGTRLDRPGYFFDNTVLIDVPRDAYVTSEEIFGPVSPIFRFSDFDEVIARANEVDVGLSSYVFTNNLQRAKAAANRIRTGTVSINHGIAQFAEAPFGGVKDSGWGRVGGSEGLNAYLTTKLISTRFD